MKIRSLLLTATAFMLSSEAIAGANDSCCEPFKQAEPICNGTGNFNAPAVYDVRECGRVSGFANASFIYWYLREEGLSVALNGVSNSGSTYLTSPLSKSPLAHDYKPGFKVCAGVVIDHEWEVSAEYTWIRSTFESSAPAPSSPTQVYGAASPSTGTPVWSVTDWFVQGTSTGQSITASQIDTTWKLNVDIVDCMAGRPFYQGRYLTISPAMGLRAMWIRQYFEVDATQFSGSFQGGGFPAGSSPSQPIRSINYSHCWSVGPRFAANSHFLLPSRFRIEGKLAGSLLYTNYTTTHKEDAASTTFAGPVYGSSVNLQHLRPVAEAGLGLGWGKYWGSNDSYHTDFLASFDFTFLWEQNMMRSLLDDYFGGTSPSAGSLFFYGLTLMSRFDF